jgi:hypothetical protein
LESHAETRGETETDGEVRKMRDRKMRDRKMDDRKMGEG